MHHIEELLEAVFNEGLSGAKSIDSRYVRLWQSMADLVFAGGKRLRPRMVFIAYDAFGGQDPQAIAPVAAAHELLHTSLIIHDDVIDRDTLRRGHKNINGLYQDFYKHYDLSRKDTEHYAHSAAILAGDLLLASAHQLIAESSLSSAQKTLAMQHLSRGIFEVAGGELLDIEATFMPFSQSSAATIARYKTASYSFIAPLLTGAALAGASPHQQENLQRFAESLGIAYQFADDILGTYGDEKITGKPFDSDIHEGKLTFLIEQYLALTPPESRSVFDAAFHNNNATTDNIKALRHAIKKSGALENTLKAIDIHTETAKKSLDSLALPKQSHDAFLALIQSVTNRQK
jgi:geranylgeranyl diphosphate synthase type II